MEAAETKIREMAFPAESIQHRFTVQIVMLCRGNRQISSLIGEGEMRDLLQSNKIKTNGELIKPILRVVESSISRSFEESIGVPRGTLVEFFEINSPSFYSDPNDSCSLKILPPNQEIEKHPRVDQELFLDTKGSVIGGIYICLAIEPSKVEFQLVFRRMVLDLYLVLHQRITQKQQLIEEQQLIETQLRADIALRTMEKNRAEAYSNEIEKELNEERRQKVTAEALLQEERRQRSIEQQNYVQQMILSNTMGQNLDLMQGVIASLTAQRDDARAEVARLLNE